MMIRYDHINPISSGSIHSFKRGDSIITGDDQRNLIRMRFFRHNRTHSVAFRHTIREPDICMSSRGGQKTFQNITGTDTIGIIISHNADASASLYDILSDPDSFFHSFHQKRIIQI